MLNDLIIKLRELSIQNQTAHQQNDPVVVQKSRNEHRATWQKFATELKSLSGGEREPYEIDIRDNGGIITEPITNLQALQAIEDGHTVVVTVAGEGRSLTGDWYVTGQYETFEYDGRTQKRTKNGGLQDRDFADNDKMLDPDYRYSHFFDNPMIKYEIKL